MECRFFSRRSHCPTRKRLKKVKCCVAGCGEVKNEVNHFHTVPNDYDRRRRWDVALGMTLKLSDRVCSDHFHQADYIKSSGPGIRKKLKRNAIPSPVYSILDTQLDEMDKNGILDRMRCQEELECPSENMTVTVEELGVLRGEAEHLLSLIKSEGCRLHIESFIRSHEADGSIGTGALGPYALFQDLASELMAALDIYDDFNLPTGFKYGVMLPETIIWSIMKTKMCSRELAETHFDELSQKMYVKK